MVSGGLVRVTAGVQVKRLHKAVDRPEIDRFVGALASRYPCGIFVTTSTFSRTSLQKASSSIPRVSTIDGDQVTGVLAAGSVGLIPETESIDEEYFSQFERRVRFPGPSIRERDEATYSVAPSDDVISLRALSYAIRVDSSTIRNWVRSGRLRPDMGSDMEGREGLYFRRNRIGEIRQSFSVRELPRSKSEWLDGFMRFAMHGRLNKSYKPVMLLAILDLIRSDGTVEEDALVDRFLSFYLRRSEAGLPVEVPSSPLSQADGVGRADVRKILIRYPLDRFVIQGYIEHNPESKTIRLRPELWESLSFRDVVALRHALEGQIDHYFASLAEESNGT